MIKLTVLKHWRKLVGLSDKAWFPPGPLHHVTIIQLQATSSMHGVRVPMWQPQSAGPVRTAHMGVQLTVNIVSHNRHADRCDWMWYNVAFGVVIIECRLSCRSHSGSGQYEAHRVLHNRTRRASSFFRLYQLYARTVRYLGVWQRVLCLWL